MKTEGFMRDSVKDWIAKYCKTHKFEIKKGKPDDYIPQSWRNENRPFSHCLNDKVTRAFNFVNKFEKDK